MGKIFLTLPHASTKNCWSDSKYQKLPHKEEA